MKLYWYQRNYEYPNTKFAAKQRWEPDSEPSRNGVARCLRQKRAAFKHLMTHHWVVVPGHVWAYNYTQDSGWTLVLEKEHGQQP